MAKLLLIVKEYGNLRPRSVNDYFTFLQDALAFLARTAICLLEMNFNERGILLLRCPLAMLGTPRYLPGPAYRKFIGVFSCTAIVAAIPSNPSKVSIIRKLTSKNLLDNFLYLAEIMSQWNSGQCGEFFVENCRHVDHYSISKVRSRSGC